MEIGIKPAGQARLAELGAEEVQRTIHGSLARVEHLLPGYLVHSLALSDGGYPKDISLLRYGTYAEQSYTLKAAVTPGGGLAPSPLTPQFDPFRIPRVLAGELDSWLKVAEQPDMIYVSAGEALSNP